MTSPTQENIGTAQRRIIEKMAGIETSLSGLYRIYAEKFPVLSELWTSLAREEEGHAKKLQSLVAVLDEGFLFKDIGRFGEAQFQPVVQSIAKAKQAAMQAALDPAQALNTTLSLEASFLETRFYEIVNSDDPAFQKVAGLLSSETRNHINRTMTHITQAKQNIAKQKQP